MRLYTQSYEYDELGNIMKMIHLASSGNWTKHYHYASNNYLLSRSNDGTQGSDEYTYDAHGNMTSMPHLASMGWDFADRLQSADLGGGGDVYYTYDAGGNRVRKVIENGNITEERIYLGDWEIYRKTVSSVLDTERETLHISDDTGRIASVDTLTVDGGSAVTTPNPVIRYQLSNHLGTATIELDTSAAVISYEEYHPFGTTSYRSENTSGAISLKRYRYVGKERDEETGLYYYGARYYAAWLARFISVDPLFNNYPYLSSYNYAGNRPITFKDIDGLQSPGNKPIRLPKITTEITERTTEEGYVERTTRYTFSSQVEIVKEIIANGEVLDRNFSNEHVQNKKTQTTSPEKGLEDRLTDDIIPVTTDDSDSQNVENWDISGYSGAFYDLLGGDNVVYQDGSRIMAFRLGTTDRKFLQTMINLAGSVNTAGAISTFVAEIAAGQTSDETGASGLFLTNELMSKSMSGDDALTKMFKSISKLGKIMPFLKQLEISTSPATREERLTKLVFKFLDDNNLGDFIPGQEGKLFRFNERSDVRSVQGTINELNYYYSMIDSALHGIDITTDEGYLIAAKFLASGTKHKN